MTYPNLMDIKGIGPKRNTTITSTMENRGWSLSDVYAMSPQDLKEIFGLPIHVARAVSEAGKIVIQTPKTPQVKPKTASFSSRSLSIEKDILVLERSGHDYPRKLVNVLGKNAPEKLFIWGNLDLLNKPSVGFCGSRNVSDKGLEITADIARQASSLGWVIVSGHARGVDSIAHRTALENDTGTIIVLPQGLRNFKLRSELKRIAKQENLLILSEFPLDAGWAVGRAMQRNSTIIGLSNAMVLVESRAKGGTFSAGKTALKYNHPLFVVHFKNAAENNEGNQYFLQRGAIQLGKSPVTQRANINPLKQIVETSDMNFPDEKHLEQLVMNLDS